MVALVVVVIMMVVVVGGGIVVQLSRRMLMLVRVLHFAMAMGMTVANDGLHEGKGTAPRSTLPLGCRSDECTSFGRTGLRAPGRRSSSRASTTARCIDLAATSGVGSDLPRRSGGDPPWLTSAVRRTRRGETRVPTESASRC